MDSVSQRAVTYTTACLAPCEGSGECPKRGKVMRVVGMPNWALRKEGEEGGIVELIGDEGVVIFWR